VRTCVDGRSLVDGSGRGVAHYTSALLEALVATHPEDEWVIVLPRDGETSLPGTVRSRLPARVLYATAALTGRPRLDRIAGGCDVVWVPAPAPLAVSRTVPLVLTVHDRSWEERPADFTRYERLWHRLARIPARARSAAVVLTTTQAGRADVIAAWGLDEARVRAVPLAPAVGLAGIATPPAAAPYFLFVGALEPRKGPDVLAAAVAAARARGLSARVVVVGGGRMDAILGVPGVEAAGRVGPEALSALLGGALALVAPSRLEGFGLPAVEALAHGTPVITSDLEPVREVLGDAALYVPPQDADALAAALLTLEADGALRASLAARGRAVVAGLSWERTAHATHDALALAARG
jgi:glycosyltransferase involved in cell wall biosynthesis